MKHTTISLLAAMLFATATHVVAEEQKNEDNSETANNAYEQQLGECMKQANAQGISDDALDVFIDSCLNSQKEEG